MKTYTFFSAATGAHLGCTYTGPDEHLAGSTPTDAVAVPGCYDQSEACLVGGELYLYTDAERARYAARPGAGWAWDVSTRAWVDARTLDDARAEAWARIKVARAAAIGGGFACNGKVYDSDDQSRANIAGAAQAAALAKAAGQPFSTTWTLADNTAAALDADQMIAVGLACLAHVDAAYARGRELRAAIEAATSNAACDAAAW